MLQLEAKPLLLKLDSYTGAIGYVIGSPPAGKAGLQGPNLNNYFEDSSLLRILWSKLDYTSPLKVCMKWRLMVDALVIISWLQVGLRMMGGFNIKHTMSHLH